MFEPLITSLVGPEKDTLESILGKFESENVSVFRILEPFANTPICYQNQALLRLDQRCQAVAPEDLVLFFKERFVHSRQNNEPHRVPELVFLDYISFRTKDKIISLSDWQNSAIVVIKIRSFGNSATKLANYLCSQKLITENTSG